MEVDDKYISKPIMPNIKRPARKFRTGSFLIAGEVLQVCHTVLPYRIAYKELAQFRDAGVETPFESRTVEQKAAVEALKEKLNDYLEGVGPRMFVDAAKPNRGKYMANLKGTWCPIFGHIYATDMKIILAVKLSFG